MLKETLVSIGLPVRNGASHIESALKSLIQQDYKNIEIIVSNNDSSDLTETIVLKYAKQDSRIKYFKQSEMLSAFENFNYVLQQASGDFFMWAAHDDIRESNYITTLIQGFINEDIILSFPDLYIDDTIHTPFLKPYTFDNSNLNWVERLYKTSDIQCYHIYGLWKTNALQKISFIHTYWWPDMPIMMAASYLGKFKYISGSKFIYTEKQKSNAQRVAYQDGKKKLPNFLVLKMIFTTYKTLRNITKNPFVPLIGSTFVFFKQLKVAIYIFLIKKPLELIQKVTKKNV